MRQNADPSVEEILQSIKQVIARDNRAGARVDRRGRGSASLMEEFRPTADAMPEEDVLELPETAQLDAYVTSPSPTPSSATPADAPVAEEQPAAAEIAMDSDDHDAEDGEGQGEPALIREATGHSMRESLAVLAMLSEPGAPPQIVRSGETSLEGMARELLRPALAEWLDQNLPQLVERMVAAEIARIVGKKA